MLNGLIGVAFVFIVAMSLMSLFTSMNKVTTHGHNKTVAHDSLVKARILLSHSPSCAKNFENKNISPGSGLVVSQLITIYGDPVLKVGERQGAMTLVDMNLKLVADLTEELKIAQFELSLQETNFSPPPPAFKVHFPLGLKVQGGLIVGCFRTETFPAAGPSPSPGGAGDDSEPDL